MTKKPHRTHPLDRDGDGHIGGSLPGNETAPMADASPPTDPLSLEAEMEARNLTPEEHQAREDLMIRETDEANAAASATPPAEQTPLEAIAEAEPDLVETTLQDAEDAAEDATFDAEQVEAGTTHADQPQTEDPAPPAEPAIPAEPAPAVDLAQVAVRIRELSILVNARRLYKSAEGYSATYGAPYIADATVQAWIEAGLAEDVPSAGNMGGVKLTPEARRQLTELKHGVAA